MRQAAALGFAGIYVDAEVGGSALSRLDAAIIFEELAQGCPSTAAYISIHNMVAWMIDSYGSDEQRRRYLPALCTMQHFGSYCLTEPDSGSDAASLKTRAVRDGDHYVLDGTKAFISGGGVSDLYIVMARTGEGGPRGISCFVVENGTPGLSFGAREKKLGWKSQPTAMVMFEGCRVPAANRLAAEGQGFKIAMRGARRRPAQHRGLFARRRAVLPRPHHRLYARAPAVRHPARRLPGARLPHRRLCHRDRSPRGCCCGAPRSRSTAASRWRRGCAAQAKRLATDTGFEVVNGCLQLHGGYGYLRDHPIERVLRDLRVHQILEGTNEIMRHIVSRDLLTN